MTDTGREIPTPAPGGARRVYIHETIVITVAERKAYLDHFTDVWGPRSRELYGMTCFGVWATSGSTGSWPEAIVIWELEGPHHLTAMMTGEFDFLTRPVTGGDHYERFWGSAPEGVVPTHGVDRLLEPSEGSRPIADLVAEGVHGAGYFHETVALAPGAAPEYLECYERAYVPVAECYGLQLVGAFRTLLRGDAEAVCLWALPAWQAWEHLVTDLPTDPRLAEFRATSAALGAAPVGKLLVGAARSPMEQGLLL